MRSTAIGSGREPKRCSVSSVVVLFQAPIVVLVEVLFQAHAVVFA